MQELTKALLAARTDVAATVFKKGQIKTEGNERAPKYNYVGHEHVLLHVRERMLNHGLVLVQTSVEFAGYAEWETRDGLKRILRWKGVHRLMHTSGESLEYACEATTNTNDKSAFVASTACDRTALLRLMQLAGSAEEDPEHHSNQQKEERAPRERTQRNTEKGRPTAQTSQGAQTGGGSAPKGDANPDAGVAVQTSSDGTSLDRYGVRIPRSPCPVFSADAKQGMAGKPWTSAAWFMDKLLKQHETGERTLTSVQLEWANYAVEHRARRKDAEAADAALGGK